MGVDRAGLMAAQDMYDMDGDGCSAFYVYEGGRLEYIDRLAPIGADNMPSDAIYTGYGFAITDNK